MTNREFKAKVAELKALISLGKKRGVPEAEIKASILAGMTAARRDASGERRPRAVERAMARFRAEMLAELFPNQN